MIAPHVPGPFLTCEGRERRALKIVNPSPLILSLIDAEYNDRRDSSALCLATRRGKTRLHGKEEYR